MCPEFFFEFCISEWNRMLSATALSDAYASGIWDELQINDCSYNTKFARFLTTLTDTQKRFSHHLLSSITLLISGSF